jgi:hypothetical protein
LSNDAGPHYVNNNHGLIRGVAKNNNDVAETFVDYHDIMFSVQTKKVPKQKEVSLPYSLKPARS